MHLFGETGFRATTVRAIAERAGVQAALVVHHFGSKEGLREAVDDQLADQIRRDEFATMTGAVIPDPSMMRAESERFAPAMAYLARALSEDANVGRHLYDRLLHDAVDYLRAGEESGLVAPTNDPLARAAVLLNTSLAQTLLQPHIMRALGEEDPIDLTLRLTGPALDLFTEGLFTDSRIRDAWNAPLTDQESR